MKQRFVQVFVGGRRFVGMTEGNPQLGHLWLTGVVYVNALGPGQIIFEAAWKNGAKPNEPVFVDTHGAVIVDMVEGLGEFWTAYQNSLSSLTLTKGSQN